jgi:polysaccharide export outer membrane protein
MRKSIALCVIFISGTASLAAQSILPVNARPAADVASLPVAHALQISSGDLLDVAVFDTPELSTKLRVDDHGEVTLPLAGAIPVSGLTAEQAGQAIETKLRNANILKQPHVSVSVLQYSTQGVTVVGEVKNPGVYPLLGARGLLDLVSAAGGVTPNAGKAITVTHRDQPSQPVVVQLDSRPGTSAALNVDLRPGDTIMVSHAGIVYVVGDVVRPGGFLIENNDRLTVLQAIAMAQGTGKTASLNKAKLIRKNGDQRTLLPVEIQKIEANQVADLTLNDGDVLFVPSSRAKNAMQSVENILPSVAGAAIFRVP